MKIVEISKFPDQNGIIWDKNAIFRDENGIFVGSTCNFHEISRLKKNIEHQNIFFISEDSFLKLTEWFPSADMLKLIF